MNFSHFFIDRPIFASVISIILVLAGVVAMLNLPIAQFPDITPPQISVSATYPGRERRGGRAERRRADRAAGQRRRQHDVHELDQLLDRRR